MATICRKLIHCLSSKHIYSRQKISNICFIKPAPFKTLCSLELVVNTHHVVPFCSQTTSKHSIGNVKKQAEVGFGTGGDKYDTHRPSYTDESVDLIVSEIVSDSSTAQIADLKYDILELGAGTGKLTEQLVKKLPGHMKYLATDPSENFLGVLKDKCLPIDIAIASADKIPLEDRSVSNIVCAQSFHWFCEKQDLESIHRVLVPGGKLILIWNIKNFNHEWMVPIYEQRMEIVKKIGGSTENVINTMEWWKDFEYSPLFKLKLYKSLSGINHHGDLEAVIASLATSSTFKGLPQNEHGAYIDELREIIKNWPGLDLSNITIPYTTELYIYTKD